MGVAVSTACALHFPAERCRTPPIPGAQKPKSWRYGEVHGVTAMREVAAEATEESSAIAAKLSRACLLLVCGRGSSSSSWTPLRRKAIPSPWSRLDHGSGCHNLSIQHKVDITAWCHGHRASDIGWTGRVAGGLLFEDDGYGASGIQLNSIVFNCQLAASASLWLIFGEFLCELWIG